MPMELVFVIGMAVLLILCIKVKANAFISLLATALVMGMLSGMSGADTVSAITSGFSGTVKSIGIVIIFGIMLGNYLDAAKGTNRMAYDAVKLVGQKRAGLAMAITGYIVSIPVFSDAAFVILTPLVKAIHKKTKIPLAILAVSLSAGLLSTHVFVPPTPGPLAAAGLLGIDIGRAILYGAFGAVFMTAAGWIFAELYFRNKPESFYTFRDEEAQKEDEAAPSIDDDKDLPGTFASLMPLVVPIVLILLNTTCGMILPEDSPILSIVSFIGDSNIALAIGAVLSIITLGKRLGGKAIIDIMDKTLKDAGPIVFITAAGPQSPQPDPTARPARSRRAGWGNASGRAYCLPAADGPSPWAARRPAPERVRPARHCGPEKSFWFSSVSSCDCAAEKQKRACQWACKPTADPFMASVSKMRRLKIV